MKKVKNIFSLPVEFCDILSLTYKSSFHTGSHLSLAFHITFQLGTTPWFLLISRYLAIPLLLFQAQETQIIKKYHRTHYSL